MPLPPPQQAKRLREEVQQAKEAEAKALRRAEAEHAQVRFMFICALACNGPPLSAGAAAGLGTVNPLPCCVWLGSQWSPTVARCVAPSAHQLAC